MDLPEEGGVGEAVGLPPEGPPRAVPSPPLGEALQALRGDSYPVFQGQGDHLVGHLPKDELLGSFVRNAVHGLQGEGEVALQVSIRPHHRQGQVVGVRVDVYAQDSVLLRSYERSGFFFPGEGGVDLSFPQGELHVVGKEGVDTLHQGVQVRVGGLHQGVGVASVSEVDPEPQGSFLDEEPQVEVAPLGLVPTGVEEALALLLPLPLEFLQGLTREVPAPQGLKEPPSPEDDLPGVFSSLPGGVQEGLGLHHRVVGVAGVQTEERAEGSIFPFEGFPAPSLKQAVVGVARGRREAAHEVQGGLVVFSGREEEEGVDSGEGFRPLLRGTLARGLRLGLHLGPPVGEYSASGLFVCRGGSLG